jgi:RNA polymerase sigma-70 factor (ECF subfamily)
LFIHKPVLLYLNNHALADIVEGCCKGKDASRKALYEGLYGYALSVCLPYANSREDAREIVNDGFLKVFNKIKELKNRELLVPWLRKIMVNTSIDYYRKSIRIQAHISTESVGFQLEEPYLNDKAIYAHLSAEHILSILQKMPATYRLVFSLYVLEGYSHQEIASQLHIAESTSRYYLTEANRSLRQALKQQNIESYARTK